MMVRSLRLAPRLTTASVVSHGLLERNGILWPCLGVVVGTDVIEFLKLLDDPRPLVDRQNNRLALLILVNKVLRMNANHDAFSTLRARRQGTANSQVPFISPHMLTFGRDRRNGVVDALRLKPVQQTIKFSEHW